MRGCLSQTLLTCAGEVLRVNGTSLAEIRRVIQQLRNDYCIFNAPTHEIGKYQSIIEHIISITCLQQNHKDTSTRFLENTLCAAGCCTAQRKVQGITPTFLIIRSSIGGSGSHQEDFKPNMTGSLVWSFSPLVNLYIPLCSFNDSFTIVPKFNNHGRGRS